ncbi:transcription factor-like protein DPB [Dorcoceras hygrometricum]|uniref:Transcription factor-like protein DPB n=1 Tax=Dorcoceras hygrometricum TaxID=472368 RepID=A0A2Z7DFR2_9LAMI|nr:transcription factor-like protein DPB [Dorcoceras hygrometricum]
MFQEQGIKLNPSQVADELVAEFSDPDISNATPDQQQYDEKNIRRRVYDALNVLMAMDIISKDKKEIQWRGLPRTSLIDVEELKNERLGFRNRTGKKAAYLAELEEQYVGLQNLIQRNEQQYGLGNAPSGGVPLPFIMVQVEYMRNSPRFASSIDQVNCCDQPSLATPNTFLTTD